MFVVTTEHKAEIIDTVWQHLLQTYPNGLFGASKDNLVNTPGTWHVTDDMAAGILYRDHHGNKIRLLFQDGTRRGKDLLCDMIKYDIEHDFGWGEIHGGLKDIMLKYGAHMIPNTDAERLLGHPITELDPDGFHYIREVAPGVVRREILLGVPQDGI